MADQLSQPYQMPAVGELAGLAGVAVIAEEAASLIARGAVSGGGKYQFQPDELRSVLAQWKQLQETIANAQTPVRVHATQSPDAIAPGNESASNTASVAAHATTSAYHDYLTSMSNYVGYYVEQLTKALNNYETTEGNNSDLAKGAHRSLEV